MSISWKVFNSHMLEHQQTLFQTLNLFTWKYNFNERIRYKDCCFGDYISRSTICPNLSQSYQKSALSRKSLLFMVDKLYVLLCNHISIES